MKKTYVVDLQDRIIRISVADDLEIDDGLNTVMWSLVNGGAWVSSAVHGEDRTLDIIGSVNELTCLPRSGSEAIVRFWLSERLNVPRNRTIETLLATALPQLARIYEHHPRMAQACSLSPRLFSALKEGDTPRDIASQYFGDACSRSDGIAFIDALNVDNSLDESRASLMVLVGPGDNRKSLAGVMSPKVWAVPSARIFRVTEHLAVPVALDFARIAISDSRSRLILSAATHLGIQAVGTHGETSYRDLCAEVLRSEVSAPHSVLEKLVALGPIAQMTVMPIKTERHLRYIVKATGNCVANPKYVWRDRVLLGEVEMFALVNGDDVCAVVAIDPKTGNILEKKGKHNIEIDVELSAEIARRLLEVKEMR